MSARIKSFLFSYFCTAVVILTGLNCSEKSNRPPNPTENQPPNALTAISPVNGATGIPLDFTLHWSASDPENDPVSYDCYFGPDSVPVHLGGWSPSASYRLPWSKQYGARQLLNQIYVMQRSYFEQQNAFCLDGASTHAGDSTFYALLGVVPELSDCYTYTITASDRAFSCTATANLDADTTSDAWIISYSPDIVTLICASNDRDFPFHINTTYYWQVIAQDDHGNHTTGPIWHFTTSSDTTLVNNYPETPQLLTPADGAVISLDTAVFSWHGSDPEGDPLVYNLYFGSTLDLQYPFNQHIQATYKPSPWLMRNKCMEMLLQIYQLQSAYHSQRGSYCLNGQTAFYGQDTFASLGAIVDSLDGYTYAMIAGHNTFNCIATANLDDDATTDTWVIDQDSVLSCTTDDFTYLRFPTGTFYWRIAAVDNHGHTTLSPTWTFATPSGE